MKAAAHAQRRLAQMAGLELGWRLHAGKLLAWTVTGLALVMSYHAEQDLGQSLAAFRGWPADLWPFSVDIADVALMVLYLEYKRLRLSTWKVWLGMVAATGVMIGANVRSVWGDPTSVLMEAWVPAIALWLWHTLAAGRRPRGAPIDLGSVWARVAGGTVAQTEPTGLTTDALDDTALAETEPDEDPIPPSADTDEERAVSEARADQERVAVRNRHARLPARSEVRRLMRHQHGALSDDALQRLAERVAERAGVSIRHARRVLREEQHPHVLGADERTSEAER
jgi:hypothetical protein